MFYFRINRLKIKDNRERARLFGMLGKDRARVKLISFVTTDQARLPDMDRLLAAVDPREQQSILRAIVAEVVQSRVLTTIDQVRDNQALTFGDTGFVLFRSAAIPADFDWVFLAVESAEDERRLGRQLLAVVEQPEFADFSTQVLRLIRTAANPSFAAAAAVGKFVATLVAQQQRAKRDQLLGMLCMSLNRREHYPHGERKRDAVPDVTGNLLIDYSLFGFQDVSAAA